MDLSGIMYGRHILEWDESDVHAWFSSLGYPQHESALRENNISGDVLCMLDSEGLKSIGVATVGQRLAILKAVYQIKLAHNVPIEEDHYVPPSEAQERLADITIDKLYEIVKDQAKRLQMMEEENKQLSNSFHYFLEEYHSLQTPHPPSDETSLRRQASFKWTQYRSPTKPDTVEPSHISPHRLEHDVAPLQRNGALNDSQHSPTEKQRNHQTSVQESPSQSPAAPKPHRSDSTDNFKSFKVSLDDPTWKVLPAALKKYKIQNDSWQNYALFICHGSTERCLSYDEKPLLLFQKLKDTKKNPVFMLKHIKDIRSPIAVAQQKQAARRASQLEGSINGQAQNHEQGHAKKPSNGLAGGGRPAPRPPRLEVNDLSATPVLSGVSPQPGWLDVVTPGGASAADDLTTPAAQVASEGTKSRSGNHGADGDAREIALSVAEVSYAVAIYPYMAEQEDEFDVVVGDTFVIISKTRARGWWIVQRDPVGTGEVDLDMSKQGWVPAGCLLETNVPVAIAIAEARASAPRTSPPVSPAYKTPILPLSILSTSCPGIALMDYTKRGEDELDLSKDDALRVFKRYNHWSYAVKEEGGDRGWVPSWFIGRVHSSAVPATPNTSIPAHSINLESDGVGPSQVSPMSSAFPAQRIVAVT